LQSGDLRDDVVFETTPHLIGHVAALAEIDELAFGTGFSQDLQIAASAVRCVRDGVTEDGDDIPPLGRLRRWFWSDRALWRRNRGSRRWGRSRRRRGGLLEFSVPASLLLARRERE